MSGKTFTTSLPGIGFAAVSPPQQLLPYQSGLVAPPLKEAAAEAQSPLNTTQRAIVLGEPIPIVFCRRVDSIGGVLVSPGATEGRFQNDGTTNELTASFQLVLSEGDLPQVQLRDFYQGACRIGTWYQTYNRRAGSWTPGNFITVVAGKTTWDCPLYCGTSGSYAGMTTLSYTNTFADGNNNWNRQIHAFVREGIQVTRILDSTLGPSNNVIDLALYLIDRSSRFPSTLIDNTAMLEAANFTNVNGFFYNGEFKESTNLEDWLEQISNPFLLRVSDKNGKKGFRPRLPINVDYTIKTTAIDWDFTFTEDHIIPGGFSIEYVSLADRKPITAQVLWRQQPDNDIGIIRTAEVRMDTTSSDGPFEQYDLSNFCVTENHAVKVGAFYAAKRFYITHTLRLNVKPDAFNSTLTTGDIVRVQMRRETDTGVVSFHDYLYEVERISKSTGGTIELDLIHFPVDSQGRSLVALAVAGATPNGVTLPTGRTDFSCNVNSSTDPVDDVGGNLPDLPSLGTITISSSNESSPGADEENPDDPVDDAPRPEPAGVPTDRPLLPGDELSYTPDCVPALICTYYGPDGLFNFETNTLDPSKISRSQCYINTDGASSGFGAIQAEDAGDVFVIDVRCADPSSPDGWGEPRFSLPTDPIGGGGGGDFPGGTFEPFPGAVTYRLSYTLGFGQVLGNFNTVPSVYGVYCSDIPTYYPGYINPDGTPITLLNKGCLGDPLTYFQLAALDANGNLLGYANLITY